MIFFMSQWFAQQRAVTVGETCVEACYLLASAFVEV